MVEIKCNEFAYINRQMTISDAAVWHYILSPSLVSNLEALKCHYSVHFAHGYMNTPEGKADWQWSRR